MIGIQLASSSGARSPCSLRDSSNKSEKPTLLKDALSDNMKIQSGCEVDSDSRISVRNDSTKFNSSPTATEDDEFTKVTNEDVLRDQDSKDNDTNSTCSSSKASCYDDDDDSDDDEDSSVDVTNYSRYKRPEEVSFVKQQSTKTAFTSIPMKPLAILPAGMPLPTPPKLVTSVEENSGTKRKFATLECVNKIYRKSRKGGTEEEELFIEHTAVLDDNNNSNNDTTAAGPISHPVQALAPPPFFIPTQF